MNRIGSKQRAEYEIGLVRKGNKQRADRTEKKKRLNRIGYKQILRYETGLDRIECKEQNIKMDLIG